MSLSGDGYAPGPVKRYSRLIPFHLNLDRDLDRALEEVAGELGLDKAALIRRLLAKGLGAYGHDLVEVPHRGGWKIVRRDLCSQSPNARHLLGSSRADCLNRISTAYRALT